MNKLNNIQNCLSEPTTTTAGKTTKLIEPENLGKLLNFFSNYVKANFSMITKLNKFINKSFIECRNIWKDSVCDKQAKDPKMLTRPHQQKHCRKSFGLCNLFYDILPRD